MKRILIALIAITIALSVNAGMAEAAIHPSAPHQAVLTAVSGNGSTWGEWAGPTQELTHGTFLKYKCYSSMVDAKIVDSYGGIAISTEGFSGGAWNGIGCTTPNAIPYANTTAVSQQLQYSSDNQNWYLVNAGPTVWNPAPGKRAYTYWWMQPVLTGYYRNVASVWVRDDGANGTEGFGIYVGTRSVYWRYGGPTFASLMAWHIPPILYCGLICASIKGHTPDRILDPASTGVPACYVDASTKRILVCYDWNHPKAKPKNYVAKAGYIWVRIGKYWVQVPDPKYKWIPIIPAHLPVPLRIGIDVPLGLF